MNNLNCYILTKAYYCQIFYVWLFPEYQMVTYYSLIGIFIIVNDIKF